MIAKNIDVKLNVRPIYIGLVHEYAYEGPCRFGEGDALEKEYDQMVSRETYEIFKQDVFSHVPAGINMMDPIYLEATDEWVNSEKIYETLSAEIDKIDLFVFNFQIARGFIYVEFAQRFHKPVAMIPHSCCEETLNTAALHARGHEAYAFYSWADYEGYLRALRTRKALQNTRVLVASRFSSVKSYGGTDNFVNLEEITNRLGVKFRNISVHELLDQLHEVDPYSNPTIPGRKGQNINAEDTALAEKLADEFIANADEVRMDRAAIIDTFKAYVLVQKLMDHYECNAFTAPCPDLCSTRRLSEERVTFCLTHSLNIENGIPSACDLDFNSLLTQAVLENLSGKSVYMGNANVCSLEDGKLPTIFGDFDDAHIDNLDDKTNLYSIFHATPTRKFDGFEQPLKKYSVDSFAYSGFGATVRYDFMQDEGQEITVCRIDPTGTKMLAAKGTIVASAGYDGKSCGQGLFFRVADNKDLFYKQCEFGCHLTLVYGDYIEDLKKFGKVTGIEIVTA